MNARSELRYTAFEGDSRLASGDLRTVALASKAARDRGRARSILIFDDVTGRRVDVDLGGTPEEVVGRLGSILPTGPDGEAAKADPRRGPGRPRLGVMAKEVTLLPRHWAWLATQRGSASATLRRLVDDARERGEGQDAARLSQDAAYRFMSALVGDRPGFEEAARALYRCDRSRFEAESEDWPPDLRAHARQLASDAFLDPASQPVPSPVG